MSFPTGNVTLTQNTVTVAASLPLDSNGNAVYSYTPTSPESDNFLAGYLAGGSDNPSTSAPLVEQVNNTQRDTVTTITASPNPAAPGQPVTVTIHVDYAS